MPAQPEPAATEEADIEALLRQAEAVDAAAARATLTTPEDYPKRGGEGAKSNKHYTWQKSHTKSVIQLYASAEPNARIRAASSETHTYTKAINESVSTCDVSTLA